MQQNVPISAVQEIYRARRTGVAVNTREYEERRAPEVDYQALNDGIFSHASTNVGDAPRVSQPSSGRACEITT